MPRLSRPALPLLLFVAVAAVVTWPLILTPGTKLGALYGPGDPYLNLWILGWDLRTLSAAPWQLLTGAVFDANIFHPAHQTLTYSDHLLLQAFCVWPIYAVSHNIVLCYNVVLFGSLVASALAMYAYLRSVTAPADLPGSGAAAIVGGLIWGFWPFHTAHLGHLQLQALYFLPLAFLFLHRLIAGGRRRDAVGLGVMVGLQAVASVYWGVIGAVAIVVSTLALIVTVGGRRAGRVIRLGAMAGIVAFLVVLPVLWPYVQAEQREGFSRNLYEAAQHEATFRSYISVPRVNLLYGWTTTFTSDRGVESELFVGFVAVGLALIGLLRARRHGQWPLAASALTLIAVGVVLSLGPDGIRPLYAFLQRWVFGFQAIRAPARFAMLAAFGLAVLAAMGARDLQRLIAARDVRAIRLAPAMLVLLILSEYVNRPLAWAGAPSLGTLAGRWLSHAPMPGAVLYLPLTIDVDNTPFMVESLEHGRPIVNGYSGLRPPFFPAVVDALHGFPTVEGMWTLKDLDVRYIVSPAPIEPGVWPLAERARFEAAGGVPARVIYEVVWTPEAEARLGEPSVPVPPPVGVIPFQIGESLVYRVDWAGPTGTVTAGRVEMTVERPTDQVHDDVAYRLVVSVRTAPWIARFFDADDRFSTDVTADLIPVRQERRLREGRRVVDEAIRFDFVRRVVVSDTDASRPPLRLWPGARDPIAAFFYLRTLALTPGTDLQIPVNDNGRNLILDVHTDRVERIALDGRAREALRVTPVLRERVERRQPITMTAWLSRDARQVPLAADVHAGFGTLRLELERELLPSH